MSLPLNPLSPRSALMRHALYLLSYSAQNYLSVGKKMVKIGPVDQKLLHSKVYDFLALIFFINFVISTGILTLSVPNKI